MCSTLMFGPLWLVDLKSAPRSIAYTYIASLSTHQLLIVYQVNVNCTSKQIDVL